MTAHVRDTHFKSLCPILITTVCLHSHHSHAIALCTDGPNGLLADSHDSRPESASKKTRGTCFALAPLQPAHRTRVIKSFCMICGSRLYARESKSAMLLSI